MSIDFRGASTGSSEESTLIIPKPVGLTTGDVMFAVLGYYDQAGPVTAPSGWTLIDSGQHSAQSYNMAAIYWKAAGGSEPSSYDWTFNGSLDEQHGAIVAYSGVNTTTPVQAWSEKLDGSSPTLTAASVTVTTAPALLLFMGGCNASGFNNTQSTTPPTGYSEIAEVHGSSYGGVYIADKWQATTGATGEVGATNTSATAFVTYLVVVNEATAGTTRNLFVSATGVTSTNGAKVNVTRGLATGASIATNTANAHLTTGATGDNPITFSAPTTASRGTAGTSLTINAPINIANDVIYIGWASDGDADVGTPSAGFTAVTGYNGVSLNAGGGVFYLWSKTSAGSEPSTYTITSTVAERSAALAFAVRNQASIHVHGTPQSNTSASSTTATVPGFTTTVTGTMRISMIFSNQGVNTVSTLTGHTQLGTVSQGSGGTVNVQYKELPTATTESNLNATLGSGGAWVGISFAVAPTQTEAGNTVNFVANTSGVTSTAGAAVNIGRPLTVARVAATATPTGNVLHILRKLVGAPEGVTAVADPVVGVTRVLTTADPMVTETADPVVGVTRVLTSGEAAATETPDVNLDNVRALRGDVTGVTETAEPLLGFIWSFVFNPVNVTGTNDGILAVQRALVATGAVTASTSSPTLRTEAGFMVSASAATLTGDPGISVSRALAVGVNGLSETSTPALSIADLINLLCSIAATSNTGPAGLSVDRALVAANTGVTTTGTPAISVGELVNLLASAAGVTNTADPLLGVLYLLASSSAGATATSVSTLDAMRSLVASHSVVTSVSEPTVNVDRALTFAASLGSVSSDDATLSIAALIRFLASAGALTETATPVASVLRSLSHNGVITSETGVTALDALRSLVASHSAVTSVSDPTLAIARELSAVIAGVTATPEVSLEMYLIVGMLRALTVVSKRPSTTATLRQ